MTIYAAMANPIISPGIIVVCGSLVFLLSILDITIEIIIAIFRAGIRGADHY